MQSSVLDFWQVVEFLTPPGLPQPGRDDGVVRLTPDEPLPWQQPVPARKGFVWRHAVYGGVLPRGWVIAEIHRQFESVPDDFATPGPRGATGLFSLTVDALGRPSATGFSVSSLAWAMGRLGSWRRDEAPDLHGFDDFLKSVRSAVAPLLADEDRIVDLSLLDRIAEAVATAAGWPARDALQGHIARSWQVRSRGGAEPDSADMLNSFFVGDLRRVRGAAAAGAVGTALRSYLASGPAEAELDVRAAPDRVDAALDPGRLPRGCWPAPEGQVPVLAQQFALNEAWARLQGGGLFSINGPPGTGKTTLLRDIVAAVVTERAAALSTLDEPGTAFTPYDRAVNVHGRSLPAWTVAESLRGFEIAVASSNNGAVENISREIPARRQVDATLADGTDYFAAVASSLLRRRPDARAADDEDDPSQLGLFGDTPVETAADGGWAMLAAVLGNGANVARFVHDFWFGKPSRDDPQLVTFRSTLDTAGASAADWETARQAFRDAYAEVETAIAAAAPLPPAADEETRQRLPGVPSPALQAARARLFLRALELHRVFLLRAGSGLRDNLSLAVDMLRGTLPVGHAALRPHLWTTLFLAVPVISTTFASFARLFRGMGPESIGWLLMDEAGQALPQAAAGALWRARRALVIGDLRQLEPVSALPEEVLSLLRERFGVGAEWCGSAQSLADRRNPVGTRLGDGADSVWVGAPLRVHRRCADPMFTVANRIAYDGMMVQGVDAAGGFETPLGPSGWFDVAGPASAGHFVEEQGDLALRLIATTMARLGPAPSLFVVSPFRTVVAELHRRLAAHVAPDWRRLSVGTVHTFQGKEADQVVLLLGGDTHVPRAFAWAAERPNLLNVAVTRARHRLYVIGDRARWGRLPYFDVLAETLPVRRLDGAGRRLLTEPA